jgi:hypothetical protein
MARLFNLQNETSNTTSNGQSGTDIAVLMTALDAHDDPRDAYALVQERIREYRSAGWSVPDELIRVERTMVTEFMAESQGR